MMKPRRRRFVAAALSLPAMPVAMRHAAAQLPTQLLAQVPTQSPAQSPAQVSAQSNAQSSPSDMVSIQQPSFVVEFRSGPKWDSSKKPDEQAFFRDHSANLKRMRERGQLIVGARYADRGWIVVNAESESAARALIEDDPSVRNGIFVFDVHPLSVFYAGCLQTTRRGP